MSVYNNIKSSLPFFLLGVEEPPRIKIDVFQGSCMVAVWYGGRYCGGGGSGGGGGGRRRPTWKIHKNREKKETGNSLRQNGNTW